MFNAQMKRKEFNMQILIIRSETVEAGKYFEASCGKTIAHVYISKFGFINVCCNNASHKAWKASGRYFKSFDDALAAYKSTEMKAIINAAIEA